MFRRVFVLSISSCVHSPDTGPTPDGLRVRLLLLSIVNNSRVDQGSDTFHVRSRFREYTLMICKTRGLTCHLDPLIIHSVKRLMESKG